MAKEFYARFDDATEALIEIEAEVRGLSFAEVIRGSPAGAGIDPWGRSRCMTLPWFPRRRGDRPERLATYLPEDEVPPQARG